MEIVWKQIAVATIIVSYNWYHTDYDTRATSSSLINCGHYTLVIQETYVCVREDY